MRPKIWDKLTVNIDLVYIIVREIRFNSLNGIEIRLLHIDQPSHLYDETELRAFFYRHYCPSSFYSMPLFLKRRGKKGRGE